MDRQQPKALDFSSLKHNRSSVLTLYRRSRHRLLVPTCQKTLSWRACMPKVILCQPLSDLSELTARHLLWFMS